MGLLNRIGFGVLLMDYRGSGGDPGAPSEQGLAADVVPSGQSRAVAANAAGPVEVVVVPGADHNDRILLDGPLIDSAMQEPAQRAACQGQ